MSAASLKIARRIAIRARASAAASRVAAPKRVTASFPIPTEPVDEDFDFAGSEVVRAMTSQGVPYVKFIGATRTTLAFGEIAAVAAESMRASGIALVRGRSVKLIAIRPFEHRDTLIDELGDEYVPALADAA